MPTTMGHEKPSSRRAIPLLVALASLLLACSLLATRASDEEQIRAVQATSNRAITERDLDALAATWSEDFQATTNVGIFVFPQPIGGMVQQRDREIRPLQTSPQRPLLPFARHPQATTFPIAAARPGGVETGNADLSFLYGSGAGPKAGARG